MSTYACTASNNQIVYGWDPTFQTYFVQVRSTITGKWLAWTGGYPFEHTSPEACEQVLSQYLPTDQLTHHAEQLRFSAG